MLGVFSARSLWMNTKTDLSDVAQVSEASPVAAWTFLPNYRHPHDFFNCSVCVCVSYFMDVCVLVHVSVVCLFLYHYVTFI